VSQVEQELLTLLEHLSSPPVFSRVRVAQSLVFVDMFVDRWFFSFGHCNVSSSIPFSDYRFFYVQTFRTVMELLNLFTLVSRHLYRLSRNKITL
jgi:hypothetical protein